VVCRDTKVKTQRKGCTSGAALSLQILHPLLDGYDGDDFQRVRIHDHEFVLVHETPVTLELRRDEHDIFWNPECVEPPRNPHPDINVEVDIGYSVSRYEPMTHENVMHSAPLHMREREVTSFGGGVGIPVSVLDRSGPSIFTKITAVLRTRKALPLVFSEFAGPRP